MVPAWGSPQHMWHNITPTWILHSQSGQSTAVLDFLVKFSRHRPLIIAPFYKEHRWVWMGMIRYILGILPLSAYRPFHTAMVIHLHQAILKGQGDNTKAQTQTVWTCSTTRCEGPLWVIVRDSMLNWVWVKIWPREPEILLAFCFILFRNKND